jgi:hypothetical protein
MELPLARHAPLSNVQQASARCQHCAIDAHVLPKP